MGGAETVVPSLDSSPLHCVAVKGGSCSGLVMFFTFQIFFSTCCLYKPTGCISREEPSRFVRDELEEKADSPDQHLSPLLQARLRKRFGVATPGYKRWLQARVVVLVLPCRAVRGPYAPAAGPNHTVLQGLHTVPLGHAGEPASSALTSKAPNLSCVSFT